MTEKRYDLHCHSIYSDGTDTVEELFQLAVKNKLSGLSITDHDTINAYEEACTLVKDYPLKLLPGVEISTESEGSSVHLLAYSFSPNDPKMISFMKKQQKAREDRNLQIIANLKEKGMPLELEELKEDIGVIGRPHIAEALVREGYVLTQRDAFDLYIAEGQSCFVPGNRPQVEEVIDVVHSMNAFAVLAHPHLIRDNTLTKRLLAMPFDGLEARYANFYPAQEKKWERLADSREWIKTGGSDYHGEIKAHIDLGASWVRDKTFDHLYNRYLENDALHRAQ